MIGPTRASWARQQVQAFLQVQTFLGHICAQIDSAQIDSLRSDRHRYVQINKAFFIIKKKQS